MEEREEIGWHEDGADVPGWLIITWVFLMTLVVSGALGLIVTRARS